MKGKPPGSRALPPAGGPEAEALKNTPPGGLAVLRALDNYQMFTGRFLMRSSSSPHPRARPASRAKRGICIPGSMARRAGVPRW
jgi:hypothetical protein